MPDATTDTDISTDDLIAWALELKGRDYAARLRELHGELGLVPFDALTPDDRTRIGGVLDGLWQLAQEMEGEG